MHENLEAEDEDILQTLDLTSRLEQSLRKLLGKKKSLEHNNQLIGNSSTEKDQSQLLNKIEVLQQQNRQLYADNQKLSQEILEVKENLRECKKQLESSKKYLSFLQDYNRDLKKELLFWVKGKKQKPADQPIVGQLMTKIIQLRKENQEKELKLNSLRKTVVLNNENNSSLSKHKRSFNFDLNKLQTQSIDMFRPQQRKNSQDYSSCYDRVKSHKKRDRHQITSKGKGKNLRKWHNNYISGCEYAY